MKVSLSSTLCAVVFLISCLHESNTSTSKTRATSNIDISRSLKDVKDLYLSNFVDSIAYIKLETNDSCFIREIDKIRFDDDYIYILNSDQFFVFDMQGNFIRKSEMR